MNKQEIISIKKPLTYMCAILLCGIFQATAHAGFYRWVDSEGQIHYSDKPNSSNAERMDIEVKKPVSDEESDDKKEEAEGEAEQGNEKQEAEPAKPEKPKVSKKDRTRYCKEAKNDIASIRSRGRMREVNAKGEYNYLSEKQKQQRLSAAKKKKREYCR